MTYHEPAFGWYPSKQKYAIRCSKCGKVLKEFEQSEFEGCGDQEAPALGLSVSDGVELRDVFGKIGNGSER